MLLNDTLLKDVNGFKLLINKDARLVYQTNDGTRYMFPLQSGSEYQAGNGLILSANTFSIDESIVADKTYVDGKIDNKRTIKKATSPSNWQFTLNYEPKYDIFINEVTLNDGQISIEPIAYSIASLNAGECASFENWITTTSQTNISTLDINQNITQVGEIPETLSGTLTHVFVRRIYKDDSSNIHEAISYAYSF